MELDLKVNTRAVVIPVIIDPHRCGNYDQITIDPGIPGGYPGIPKTLT